MRLIFNINADTTAIIRVNWIQATYAEANNVCKDFVLLKWVQEYMYKDAGDDGA